MSHWIVENRNASFFLLQLLRKNLIDNAQLKMKRTVVDRQILLDLSLLTFFSRIKSYSIICHLI